MRHVVKYEVVERIVMEFRTACNELESNPRKEEILESKSPTNEKMVDMIKESNSALDTMEYYNFSEKLILTEIEADMLCYVTTTTKNILDKINEEGEENEEQNG